MERAIAHMIVLITDPVVFIPAIVAFFAWRHFRPRKKRVGGKPDASPPADGDV